MTGSSTAQIPSASPGAAGRIVMLRVLARRAFGHAAQEQQLSRDVLQLARALSHLLAAQSSPGSCLARSQIFSWLRQIEPDSVQASVQRWLGATWQLRAVVTGGAG